MLLKNGVLIKISSLYDFPKGNCIQVIIGIHIIQPVNIIKKIKIYNSTLNKNKRLPKICIICIKSKRESLSMY